MTQLPALLTIEEAADALRVHPETLRRWVRDGKVDSVDLPGRTIRLRRTDVEALIGGAIADAGRANPAFLLVPVALLLGLVIPYSFALNVAVYALAIPTAIGLGVSILRGRRDRTVES